MSDSVRAILALNESKQGGRATAVSGNYRPQVYFQNPGASTTGFIRVLEEDGYISPGSQGLVDIDFLNREVIGEHLVEGQRLLVREGPKVVGTLTVLGKSDYPGLSHSSSH